MIKILKSNKLISLLLVIMCIFFIIKPSLCSTSCLNAISVWAFKVLPMLLPFFILTRLLVNLSSIKPNIMDKFFNFSYKAPNGSFLVFFLSVLAGYPMGAKLISSMHESNLINTKQAETMLSFCSVSGPMFIIGTVGVSIFDNYKVGVIMLISNILACLINGFIYRNKTTLNTTKNVYTAKNKLTLADVVYDSLISILMVGAYIVLSFIIIDVLKNLCIISAVSSFIEKIVNVDGSIISAVLMGVIEITRGCLAISETSASLCLQTILCSTVIAFGGISVFMQSLGFLKNIDINKKLILTQKITQCLICCVVSTIICLLFF